MNPNHLSNLKEPNRRKSYIVISETNKRPNNEDSFQIFSLSVGNKEIQVLALADGMGGLEFGEEVSRETLRKLSVSLFELLTVNSSINIFPEQEIDLSPPLLSNILYEAIKQTNAHIIKVRKNYPNMAGSTIVVALIVDHVVIVGNLGDSPLFYYRAFSNKVTQITQDHTVAAILERHGMISPEMSRYHHGRNRLQFFVGCEEFPVQRPIYQIDVKSKDLLLLCSDGVSSSLSVGELEDILLLESDLKKIGRTLIKNALARGETDNQTLILWRCLTDSGPNWNGKSFKS
ncbi:MAG: protein phosphatase 2C domain-containing protein [Prochloraceae cyanobacterium]|nr:protein phosphatase 2C domain-containing protein [Prochloraceae cyanobacterium]